MDPGERRLRTPAALTAALLALGLALAACGAEAPAAPARSSSEVFGAVEAADPGAPGVPGAAGAVEAAPPPADVFRAADPELAARLESRVRGVVGDSVRRAVEQSGGKLAARDVVVSVCARAVGEVGYRVALEPDAALVPASNAKLLTTAAALVVLGPGWHFETRFEAGAPIRDGLLMGDLIVRAGADPLYDADADGEVAHLFAPVVEQLAGRGLVRVAGDLVLDEAGFGPPEPGPGWPDPTQHWQDYCALSGAFSANGGCLTAIVRPRSVGDMAGVEVRPHAHGLPTDLRVRTTAGGKLNVAVEAVRGKVVVRGTFPGSVPVWRTSFAHPDPVELFASSLVAALHQGRIELDGRRRRERGVPPGELLAVLRSPLVDLLEPINTHSMNAVADQVFLAMGFVSEGAGTRQAGARAVRAALEELGVDSEGLVQVDGSGLSRENRVRAEQIVALLEAVARGDPATAEAFRASLAVAGRTGTLDGRMQAIAGQVRAKTGWISGASALSGFATTDAGELLAFSILVSYPRIGGLNSSCWKPMQDGICQILVQEGS